MSHDPNPTGTPSPGAMDALFDGEDVQEVMRERFYKSDARPPRMRARRTTSRKPAADHYKTICISMYLEDLARLDAKVAELKRAGHRKMNRSALIRFALDQVDTNGLPRSY